MSNPQQIQLRDLPRKQAKLAKSPPGYDPLGTCPPKKRDRYRNTAIRASNGSLAAIVKLKCLECVCWEHSEVKRCEISGCALWPRARKDLSRDSEPDRDGSEHETPLDGAA